MIFAVKNFFLAIGYEKKTIAFFSYSSTIILANIVVDIIVNIPVITSMLKPITKLYVPNSTASSSLGSK